MRRACARTLTSGLVLALFLRPGSAAAEPPGLTSPTPPASRHEAQARTAWWKPLALFGGGVAITGVGFALQWKARSDNNAFERELSTQCADDGCTPDEAATFQYLEDRAVLENNLAIAAWIVGGAALAGGVAWGVWNRPRTVQLAPAVRGDGGGVVVWGRF